jgi:hypothetical protein
MNTDLGSWLFGMSLGADDDELNCPWRIEKQQKERCCEDGEPETRWSMQ